MDRINWRHIGLETFEVFLKFILIYGSFHFSKYFVQTGRKDKTEKAKPLEIIITYTGAIFLTAIISAIIYDNLGSRFFILWLTLCLPSVLGIWDAYTIDSKLTKEERVKLKLKIEAKERQVNNVQIRREDIF